MESGTQYSSAHSLSMLNQVAKMKGILFNEAIGSVLWPAVVSRPDVAYAVGVLSQFIQNPGPAHWEGLKRIINYLNSMKNYWLTCGGGDKDGVEGYSDADWAGQKDRHSISGYSFVLGKGAITWSLKKQHIITLLSMESEYIAQTHAAKEAMWRAIALAKDNKFHARTKHIDLRYHFLREAVEDERICFTYIPTEDNVADIFTKALLRPKFVQLVGKLGLREMSKEGKEEVRSIIKR